LVKAWSLGKRNNSQINDIIIAEVIRIGNVDG